MPDPEFPEDVVCTDMPWATAWYGDQPSLLLPRGLGEFYRLRDGGVPVRGVYLTMLTGGRPYVDLAKDGGERVWLSLYEGTIPEGFPFRDAVRFPRGRLDQVFVSEEVTLRGKSGSGT